MMNEIQQITLFKLLQLLPGKYTLFCTFFDSFSTAAMKSMLMMN